jgi:hypothetical protein
MAIRPRAFALVVESTEISAFGEHPIAVEPCPCVAEAAVVFFDSTRARHAGVGSKVRGEPGGDGGQRLSRVCNEVRVNEAEARMKKLTEAALALVKREADRCHQGVDEALDLGHRTSYQATGLIRARVFPNAP